MTNSLGSRLAAAVISGGLVVYAVYQLLTNYAANGPAMTATFNRAMEYPTSDLTATFIIVVAVVILTALVTCVTSVVAVMQIIAKKDTVKVDVPQKDPSLIP